MEDVGKEEIHHRHFYHLLCGGNPPEQWQHEETDPSKGGPAPIRFEFFWAAIPHEVPKLICDHGILLSLLEARLKWDDPTLL
jgi:8-oxo-dGTP diphosphatase